MAVFCSDPNAASTGVVVVAACVNSFLAQFVAAQVRAASVEHLNTTYRTKDTCRPLPCPYHALTSMRARCPQVDIQALVALSSCEYQGEILT